MNNLNTMQHQPQFEHAGALRMKGDIYPKVDNRLSG
jgi:hypothetical protein